MFEKLKKELQSNFTFGAEPLYVVDVEKNELFSIYLRSLPEHMRAHHTCNACRSFMNHYGGIVSISSGTRKTLWDFTFDVPEWEKVTENLRNFILSRPISSPFLSETKKCGTDFNHEMIEGRSHRWDHFFISLPASFRVTSRGLFGKKIGDARTLKSVIKRSFEEITPDTVETVLDLITSNSLYRGAEFLSSVKEFSKNQNKFLSLQNEIQRDDFSWTCAPVNAIRNTAIGTLLVDLSGGKDVETSVRAFETIMAPANYRRSSAPITTGMIKKAKETIEELGLTESLKRRHATSQDIPKEFSLFVRPSSPALSVFDEMAKETKVTKKSWDRSKKVDLETFLRDVLPNAHKVELFTGGEQNAVSLITPVDPTSPSLFGWDNKISWTYANDLTDSLKEKVKKAGGNVDCPVRISLEWFNYDDLDLHVHTPGRKTSGFEGDGSHIWFSSKRNTFGFLDVDMNAGSGTTREPVENVALTNPKTGKYQVRVHQFSKRENKDLGFNIQIVEHGKEPYTLRYSKGVNGYVDVAEFNYSPEEGITNFRSDLERAAAPSDGTLREITHILWSPNHWGENAKGNKHLFFIVDGMRNNGDLRGFFNEFLHPSLNEHRKVFETLGDKFNVPPSNDQMSGFGFSTTQKHEILLRVDNKNIKLTMNEPKGMTSGN